MKRINFLRKINNKVGFSDHSNPDKYGNVLALVALSKGVDVIERHFTILKKEKTNIGYKKINSSNSISKISVVGVGMRSHAGVAQTLFDTLGKNKINIQVITTSEIKISILIDEKFTDIAVQKLHQAFKLHK